MECVNTRPDPTPLDPTPLHLSTKGAILDVNPVNNYTTRLRRELDELCLFWSGYDKPRKPGWIAKRTAEMLNHIRNNLFHGIKAPDDAADRALLEHVNPLLAGCARSQKSVSGIRHVSRLLSREGLRPQRSPSHGRRSGCRGSYGKPYSETGAIISVSYIYHIVTNSFPEAYPCATWLQFRRMFVGSRFGGLPLEFSR